MIACISIFGQAAAAILTHTHQKAVQYHDYHGCASLLHLPTSLMPVVCVTAHNAHYNAEFPMATAERKAYLLSMMGLMPPAATAAAVAGHGGSVAAADLETGRLQVSMFMCAACSIAP